MARRKDIYWGKNNVRMSVSNRKSPAARPWNDPEVVDASQRYGVPFTSYKGVVAHENTLESMGSLEENERVTCNFCGRFKTHKDHEEHF